MDFEEDYPDNAILVADDWEDEPPSDFTDSENDDQCECYQEEDCDCDE